MKIGIDPGNKGAIAVLTNDDKFVDVVDMPTFYKNVNGKQKLFIDDMELFHLLHSFKSPDGKNTAALEIVGAMSKGGTKQGATSMFNFGMGYGAVKMALAVLDYEIKHIAPVTWKRQFGLIGCSKADSIPQARAFIKSCGFDSDEYVWLKKHDGRADAILLANMLSAD